MADQYPSDKSLQRSFFDLLKATDEPDRIKRHEAIRQWWTKNVVTVSCQTTIEWLTLAATRDRLGMIASVWDLNSRKMANKVIQDHGLTQRVPPPDELPTDADEYGFYQRYCDNRDLTWLTRISIVKP
jgi:hypothetical protein